MFEFVSEFLSKFTGTYRVFMGFLMWTMTSIVFTLVMCYFRITLYMDVPYERLSLLFRTFFTDILLSPSAILVKTWPFGTLVKGMLLFWLMTTIPTFLTDVKKQYGKMVKGVVNDGEGYIKKTLKRFGIEYYSG